MKVIGIDYGSKKSGIAEARLTDEAFLAFPLKVVSTKELLEEIKVLAPQIVVLGHSLNLQNKENPIMNQAKEFAKSLKKLGIKVVFIDERFSTQQAKSFSRLLKKKDKNFKPSANPQDAQAAAIILQSFLDMLKHKKEKMV